MDETASILSDMNTPLMTESHGGVKGMARHTIGMLLLLCVCLLWTAGNFLTSSVVSDDTYAKPFFIVYLNGVLLVTLIIPTLCKELRGKQRNDGWRRILQWTFLKHMVKSLLSEESDWAASTSTEHEALLKSHINQVQNQPSATHVNDAESTILERGGNVYLGPLPTARLALRFFFLWSAANYFVVACLQHTNVASSTILCATSSVWTLLVGAMNGTERFTWRKLCGVLASILGVVLISSLDFSSGTTNELYDGDPADHQALGTGFKITLLLDNRIIRAAANELPQKTAGEMAVGDCLALLSAIVYGFYSILLKHSTLTAQPLTLHMPTFFGFVGLFSVVLLLPLFPLLHLTGIESFAWPPDGHTWMILVLNSLSSLGSDIVWAYAMLFTSPLVSSVALSLNIPLSLIGEMVIQRRYKGPIYWLGAMIVLASFVFVEREEARDEEEIREEYGRRSMHGSKIIDYGSRSLTDAFDSEDPRRINCHQGTGKSEYDLIKGRGKQNATTDDLERYPCNQGGDRDQASPDINIGTVKEIGNRGSNRPGMHW